MSSLKRIRLIREEGQAPGIKAILSFDSYTPFNIITQSRSLAIQTPLTGGAGGGEVLVAEEASAIPDALVIQEAAMVDSAAPSLDQIVDEMEVELQDDEERIDEMNLKVPPLREDTEPQAIFSITDTQVEPQVETKLDDNLTPAPVEEKTDESQDVLQQLFEEKPEEPLEVIQEPLEEKTEEPQEVIRQPVEEKPDQMQDLGPRIPWDDRVSFQFVNQSIVSALRLVSGANELNMVIDEGVEGSVTMDLRGVTLRQALDKIVHTHECEYIVDNGIITVKPVKTVYTGGSITKVYRLKYADAANVAEVLKQVVSGDSLVQVYHPEFLSYEDSGKNRKEGSPVAVQGIRRSSTLVVTDRPEKIRQVDKVIEELDRQPTQIVIESKLVELSPMNSNELGINWDKTISTVLWGQSMLSGGDIQDYSFFNQAPNEGGDWKMGNLSAGKYQAVLDFLKEKTDSKLKSNPRLLAMDNEESSISVGTTVPVPRIQRGLGGQGDMVTFEYKEVNIQLNVTPHVAEDNKITMYVNPVIEEITGWVEYLQHRAPITDKRAVNSIVSVKNGETVVIGGLIKSQRIKTISKVWLLGSIPLIGKLFQHEKFEDKQTDLMIFITPTIVR